LSDIVFRE